MSGKNLSALRGECTSLADSPCIGWCTVRQFGDERCKGCGRTLEEIRDWAKYPSFQKKIINVNTFKIVFCHKLSFSSIKFFVFVFKGR